MKLLSRIGGLILSVLAIIGYFVAIIDAQQVLGNWFYLLLIVGITLTLLFPIFAVALFINNSSFIRRFVNYHSIPKPNFVFLKKDIEYHFTDRTNIHFRKSYIIKSHRRDLTSFPERYRWSGDTPCELTPEYSDTTITILPADVHWNYFLLNFNRPLGKKQIGNAGILMTLEDTGMTSKLFLSTGIFEPTEEIVLVVKISNPLKFKEDSTKLEVSNSYYDFSVSESYDIMPTEFNGGYALTFRLRYPLKDAKYLLKWEFEGG